MYGVEDKTGKERNERLKIKNERKDLLACLRWKRKCVVVVDLCACALRICLERYPALRDPAAKSSSSLLLCCLACPAPLRLPHALPSHPPAHSCRGGGGGGGRGKEGWTGEARKDQQANEQSIITHPMHASSNPPHTVLTPTPPTHHHHLTTGAPCCLLRA